MGTACGPVDLADHPSRTADRFGAPAAAVLTFTDVYLLGLAARRGGHLATLDPTVPVKAVRGAARDTLEVIAPAEAS